MAKKGSFAEFYAVPSQYKNIKISSTFSLQPRQNYNEWRLLYFISFLLLVGFFVLNMFVGVVVENFHRCRAEVEKEERAAKAVKRAHKLLLRRKRKEQKKTFNM